MEFITPFVETYAFCLLPNHFHFLVKIREKVAVNKGVEIALTGGEAADEREGAERERDPDVPHFENVEHLECLALAEHTIAPVPANNKTPLYPASEAFRRLFTSYAKAINKQENRHGSLLEKPFGRIHIDSERYFRDAVGYIHYNPMKHHFSNNIMNYQWSSFYGVLNNQYDFLEKIELLKWFDGMENFIEFHTNRFFDVENTEYIYPEQ